MRTRLLSPAWISPAWIARRRMPEESQNSDHLWFGKSNNRLGFGPLNWQGRAATFLYVFLVIVAIFLYSQLGLTIFVIGFYTVAFGLIVAIKSDVMKGWPPGP